MQCGNRDALRSWDVLGVGATIQLGRDRLKCERLLTVLGPWSALKSGIGFGL
jgi:hypothetical protein